MMRHFDVTRLVANKVAVSADIALLAQSDWNAG